MKNTQAIGGTRRAIEPIQLRLLTEVGAGDRNRVQLSFACVDKARGRDTWRARPLPTVQHVDELVNGGDFCRTAQSGEDNQGKHGNNYNDEPRRWPEELHTNRVPEYQPDKCVFVLSSGMVRAAARRGASDPTVPCEHLSQN